ncbi:MAG: hypothetical protein ABEI11_00255 [Haloarculaceae archaeon]
MRGPRAAVVVAVVIALLLGTQLAFTTVGETAGDHWSSPEPVAAIPGGTGSVIPGAATAGGAGGVPGAVAWIERVGDRNRIRVARLRVDDGTVRVTDRRTVATATRTLAGVDVAVRGGDGGGEVAVTWEVRVEDRAVLARIDGSGVTRTVAADPFRLNGPSVAYAAGDPVVAWTGRTEGETAPGVYLRRSGGDPVPVAGPTDGAAAPVLAAPGEDRLAVAWFRANDSRAVVTGVDASSTGTLAVGDSAVVGAARVQGSFGGATREVPFLAAAANDTALRLAWTDLGEVRTAAVEDGRASRVRTVAAGGEAGVGARGDRWTVAWTVPDRATDDDAYFLTEAGIRGVLARTAGNENGPTPVYAPEPAAVWVSWGDRNRVLASAYSADPVGGPLRRLGSDPVRFAFVGLAAGLVAIVTTPLLPWSFVALLGAFLVTTRTVSDRALAALAHVPGIAGADGTADPGAVRDRLTGLPAAAWVLAFAAVEVPLTWWFVTTSRQLASVGFASPVAVSLIALVAALAVTRALELRSGWRAVVAYVLLQNAALWNLAVPSFL